VDQSVRTGEYHNVDDVFHDDEGSSERTRLLPSATVSEAQPSVPAPTVGENQSETYRSDWQLEEELVLRVVRPAGAGLGISVAGGVGSTPYRCNDQVRTRHTRTRTHTHTHTHTHGTHTHAHTRTHTHTHTWYCRKYQPRRHSHCESKTTCPHLC